MACNTALSAVKCGITQHFHNEQWNMNTVELSSCKHSTDSIAARFTISQKEECDILGFIVTLQFRQLFLLLD